MARNPLSRRENRSVTSSQLARYGVMRIRTNGVVRLLMALVIATACGNATVATTSPTPAPVLDDHFGFIAGNSVRSPRGARGAPGGGARRRDAGSGTQPTAHSLLQGTGRHAPGLSGQQPAQCHHHRLRCSAADALRPGGQGRRDVPRLVKRQHRARRRRDRSGGTRHRGAARVYQAPGRRRYGRNAAGRDQHPQRQRGATRLGPSGPSDFGLRSH